MTGWKSISLTALICGCIMLFSADTATGQPIEREPLRIKSTVVSAGTRPAIPRKPVVRRTANVSALLKKAEPKRTRTVADKTTDLEIKTEPNAVVILTALNRRGATPIRQIARNGIAEFNNLLPGSYKISAALNEFIEQESEVNIPAQDSLTLSFPLEPIKYQLNFETNISEGEVRYAPARLVGKNPDGSLKLEPEGNYCIVQIRNKKASIKGLTKDYYTIDVNPGAAAIEFEPLQAVIEPDDIVDEEDTETEDLKIIDIKLEEKISTQTFASAWTTGDWELTSGWTVRNKLSTGGVSGIALPRNPLYRYYTNFELISDVISLDGKNVSFALRAIDARNYYLVEIAGANAAEPLLVKGYVVKNGVAAPIYSNNISHFESNIRARKSFRVIIRGRGNTFEVFIEDNRGTPQPLGNIIDSFGNFKKGAIGIAERGNSNFEVGFFTVCPAACR